MVPIDWPWWGLSLIFVFYFLWPAKSIVKKSDTCTRSVEHTCWANIDEYDLLWPEYEIPGRWRQVPGCHLGGGLPFLHGIWSKQGLSQNLGWNQLKIDQCHGQSKRWQIQKSPQEVSTFWCLIWMLCLEICLVFLSKRYPKGAWYSYNDTTCNYNCMATEYIWWAYCAYSGICDARKNTTDFTNEFKFQTKKGLQSGDKMVTQLLENQNGYVFPLKHADGKYKGCGTCSTTGSVSVHGRWISSHME